MFKIVDENGKEFTVSISDIADMTTDAVNNGCAISDAEKFKVKDFNCAIVDAEGNSLDISKLNDSETKEQIVALDVLFEATHSGINRNNWNYYSDSMEKDTTSWNQPYKKPLLKNHDMYVEPLGRVQDAYHGKSEFNDERDCINVVFRVTDKDAMDKFLDGRYRTMSIGGSVGHVSCSICGKDILEDGAFKFCGHWRGETYAGQKAIWNAKDIEYKEGSIVNSPADDWAQVKKITVIKQSNPKDNEPESTVATKDSDDDFLNVIDKAIAENATPVQDEEVPENKPEGVTDNTTEGDGNQGEVSDSEYKAKYEEVSSKLADKETEVSKLEEKNSSLTDENETLTQSNILANEELSNSKARFIKLSISYKKALIKCITQSEVMANNLSVEDGQAKETELNSKTMKELSEMFDSIEISYKDKTIEDNSKDEEGATADNVKDNTDSSNTSIPKIANPAIVNINDKNSINDDSGEEKVVLNDASYSDIEKSIIDAIFK